VLKYIAVIGLVLYVLKLTGFCFSDPGWRTDRQLIETAFRVEKAREYPRGPAVPDVSTYLRDVPQCCSVRNADNGIFINALFGRSFDRVTIKYPVIEPSTNDGQPFYERVMIIDCCGKDVVDRSGIPFSAPIPAGPPVEVEVRRS